MNSIPSHFPDGLRLVCYNLIPSGKFPTTTNNGSTTILGGTLSELSTPPQDARRKIIKKSRILILPQSPIHPNFSTQAIPFFAYLCHQEETL